MMAVAVKGLKMMEQVNLDVSHVYLGSGYSGCAARTAVRD
jgi:hypothetical protein